jgi:hypothetical protein
MPRRLKTWAGACLLASALALALSSCGGDSPEATANARTTPISAPADPSTGSEAPQPKAPFRRAASSCLAQLDPLLKAMETLRKSLVAGLAYEQYVAAVKKIMATYDAVPADKMTLGCVQSAGRAGEQALNRYIAASNTWTDCVKVPSCEAVSVEAPLQTSWREASRYLSKAERGLASPSAG